MRKREGSITIFAALSLMLVAQLIFTLLEAARNVEYHKVLQMDTDAVLESVFADYVSPMWEQYRLLGFQAENSENSLSFNNLEAEMRNLSGANLGSRAKKRALSGNSLLTADLTDVEFSSYLLMTDQEGKVFEAAVSSYMKNNLAYEAARSVYDAYESAEGLFEDYGDGDSAIGEALDALENLESEAGAAGEDTSAGPLSSRKGASSGVGASPPAENGEAADNPLTAVTEAQKKGILTLVLPENTEISGARINLEGAVSHRSLACGSGRTLSADWYDEVLMNQYLMRYLTAYTDGAKDRGLNYELEYLIGGRGEDAANLKVAVAELLAIREAMNLASLAASPERQGQAMELALLLAGISVNPVIIEAVKYGLMAAWAYVESILDLRTLLAGGKVAMVKSDAEWTSNLSAIPSLLSGYSQAKGSPNGKSYRDYLSLLLFTHSGETLAMRAMDVQEAMVRRVAGYEDFRMDCVVCEAGVCATYSYVPVFLGFVTLLPEKTERFCIQRSSEYSYLENLTE